jgi:2-amino-4-hydroxy-6-hydroxymethyldihydropteridine diphosphokinase
MQTYLLTGSNKGNREQNLNEAIRKIKQHIGEIKSLSVVAESEPWGFSDKNWFLNQVVEVETKYNPVLLLKKNQFIEGEMGRQRKEEGGRYQPRIIDIDILYYEKEKINTPTLTIPHPHIQNRRFTLFLLADLAPDYVHPVLKKTHTELLHLCTDKSIVKKNSQKNKNIFP